MDQKTFQENALYQAWLNTWTSSRMERDRVLIAVSSLAIGALIPAVAFSGRPSCLLSIIFVCVGMFLFAVVIGICLAIYSMNAKYLEMAIRDWEENKSGKLLHK